jgi:hypothetical protein
MAPPFFKSKTETPWDNFTHAMNRALRSVGHDFLLRHNRRITLGSPVLMAETEARTVRIPVEVRGGPRQYSVAFLNVRDVDKKPNSRRIQELARELVRIAEPYATTPPAKPNQVVLTYP